jgi:acetyl-CoA carboxylase alpha subunit
VLGEGGSGGALAIGVGDAVLALENSVYSVISPEGCASILWRDPEKAPIAAAAMRMTAADQLELGVVDAIIDEPKDGAQADPGATARSVKAAVISQLQRISQVDPEALLTGRYARLRATGLVLEAEGEGAPQLAPVTMRGRIGRLLRIPVRAPRWSEIWPSGAEDGTNEGDN